MSRLSSARIAYKLVALLLLIVAVSVSAHKSFAVHVTDHDHSSCAVCVAGAGFGLAIAEPAFELIVPVQVTAQELSAPLAPSFVELPVRFRSRAPPYSL